MPTQRTIASLNTAAITSDWTARARQTITGGWSRKAPLAPFPQLPREPTLVGEPTLEEGQHPQAGARSERSLDQPGGQGLPVPAAGEGLLVSGEEASGGEGDRKQEDGHERRDAAAASELSGQLKEPTASRPGGSEGEEDRVLREDRQLQVELIAAEREE